MSEQSERGWRLHNLSRLIDESITEALDELLELPELAEILDAMQVDEREQFLGAITTIRVPVSVEAATFLSGEQGIKIVKNGD